MGRSRWAHPCHVFTGTGLAAATQMAWLQVKATAALISYLTELTRSGLAASSGGGSAAVGRSEAASMNTALIKAYAKASPEGLLPFLATAPVMHATLASIHPMRPHASAHCNGC